eukprot:m.192228 g.192228  ORF g.192228 m.192228 type:complete len:172 (-) comp17583_c0_seq1:539-1054(-)
MAAPSSTLLTDEELARQLQAQDNGLRSRKRSSASFDDHPHLPRAVSRGSKKQRSPNEHVSESVSSPDSPASSEPELSPHPLPCDNFCQGCGKLLTDASSILSPGVAALSKENFLNCSTCVALYAIPPSPGGRTFAPTQASPPHRCKFGGCWMTFLFAEKLHDHRLRVHGRK